MSGEIIGEALAESLRFVGRVLWEIGIEFAIRGAGYVICRMFKREVDPEAVSVVLVGLAFWIAIVSIALSIWR